MMQEEQAIEQFLGDQPRSEEWARMRQTLLERLRRVTEERDALPSEQRAGLDARIRSMREQIAVLEREELVTRFVEDSVRVTLAMGSAVDSDPEA
jgi:hypothetical protein